VVEINDSTCTGTKMEKRQSPARIEWCEKDATECSLQPQEEINFSPQHTSDSAVRH